MGDISGTFTGTVTGVSNKVKLTNETSDTTCFPIFSNDATGNRELHTNSGLLYDSSTNSLTASTFVGSLTGNAATAGTATTVTGATQAAITSVSNGALGLTVAGSGALTATTITSSVATGTAPFTVASTTQVANLNAATAGTVTGATQTAITSVSTGTNGLAIAGTGALTIGGDIITLGNVTNGNDCSFGVLARSGTNTTGKKLTVHAGAGTGTGSGGNIEFQVAKPGASGSTVNPLSSTLTLYSDLSLSAVFAGNVFVDNSANLTVSNYIFSKTSVTNYLATDITVTYGHQGLIGGLITHADGAASDVTATLPIAAELFSAIPNCAIGTSFQTRIKNNNTIKSIIISNSTDGTTTFDETSTPITLIKKEVMLILVVCTNATTPAFTCYYLGHLKHEP